jgi:hypothetical protein
MLVVFFASNVNVRWFLLLRGMIQDLGFGWGSFLDIFAFVMKNSDTCGLRFCWLGQYVDSPVANIFRFNQSIVFIKLIHQDL